MHLWTDTDILLKLTDILEDMNSNLWENFKVPGENRSCLPEEATLKEMGIGGSPLGHGELLDLKDRIEKSFGIMFTQDELPDFFQSRQLTLKQLTEAISKKVREKSG